MIQSIPSWSIYVTTFGGTELLGLLQPTVDVFQGPIEFDKYFKFSYTCRDGAIVAYINDVGSPSLDATIPFKCNFVHP